MRILSQYSNKIVEIEEFQDIFMSISPKKWMLVCDNSFNYLPINVKNLYEKFKSNCIFFDEVLPNPTFEIVEKGLKKIKSEGCSLIVAIGGGSAIDVAKCIKLFYGLKNCSDFFNNNHNIDYVKVNEINLIAMPTTAGTGSESTKHAVIYYNGQKQSICDDAIIPDIAVIYPEVLKTLPIKQKKSTMLDALCQGLESWWSVNSTDESKKYSEFAVNTIVSNYKSYIFDNDSEASKQIFLGANAAGKAINITQTTAPHAMSYKITSLYNLPHGHAVAICLPVVWKYMIENFPAKCVDKRGVDYLKNVFAQIPINAEWFNKLLAELEIENPVAVNKISEIELLTQSVNPVRLKNNPVYLESTVLKNMYEKIIM